MVGPRKERRASPPRAAFLLEDILACRDRLSQLKLELQRLQDSAEQDSQALEQLVWKFRGLRESLLALSSRSADAALAAEVSEASAAACCLAKQWPELLKSLRYFSSQTSHAMAILQWCPAGREAQMIGLLLLFFICVPPQPQGQDILGLLQKLPRPWRHECQPVQHALAVHRALASNDCLPYHKLLQAANWQQQSLMQLRLRQVQEQGMQHICAAYRSLDLAATTTLLGLQSSGAADADRLAIALVRALADQGNARAEQAYTNWQMEPLSRLTFHK